MTSRRMLMAAVCWAVLGLGGTALAQETALTGTLVDDTGAVLPGGTVTALHVDSGNTFVSVTDAAGQYRLGALRTGGYKVTVELPGFTTAIRENLELLLGQRATVNFTLRVSSVQESVTVTAEAPLLNTSQSQMGGNIDPRQMQELPVNGRNWLDLTMLAPGSRVNAVNPAVGVMTPEQRPSYLQFQINMDGQQVTNMTVGGGQGQPKFSRDAISEYEFISNRFDATQGRSAGVQVNAITKSGTNRFSGTSSGYFRSDAFNAKDFIVDRVLPYSNQQLSQTFGGPIMQDRVHFFGNYEYEREPRALTYTSVFPRFNAVDFRSARREDKGGGRIDVQLNQSTRLMGRGSRYVQTIPFSSGGGATAHPSGASSNSQDSGEGFATLTQVFGNNVIHELKGGYALFAYDSMPVDPGLAHAPNISLRGYTIGKGSATPLDIRQYGSQVRDDVTFALSGAGRHDLKVGGEVMYVITHFADWAVGRDGTINATGGPIPANIQDLFPVWNDPSTWNIAALSPLTRRYQQTFGTYSFKNRKTVGAAWIQDNWAATSSLTLNLGLRYDVSVGALAEKEVFLPFLPTPRSTEKLNFQPRLGFAYTLGDARTVIRGGWGKYYPEVGDGAPYHLSLDRQTATVGIANDRRPNFAADPFNGAPPTFEQAVAFKGRDLSQSIGAMDLRLPYSWQSSIGLQRQIAQTMAFEADYVYTGGRNEHPSERNVNLSYNPATGANYPFSDVSKRPNPDWGSIWTYNSDGWSNYHGLQTAFTKRLSQGWQASATYTLSGFWNAVGAPTGPCLVAGVIGPCPADFKAAPDLGGEYTLAEGDQRHRAVFNGIGQLPYGFQLSGLYFFGSGTRYATSYGADLRDRGPATNSAVQPGRLRPNGTIMPRNALVGTPLHRVDLRVSRRFPIHGRVTVTGMFDAFNLFNHVNYGSFTTVESSASYGQPQQNTNVAYQPRILQLGFRVAF